MSHGSSTRIKVAMDSKAKPACVIEMISMSSWRSTISSLVCGHVGEKYSSKGKEYFTGSSRKKGRGREGRKTWSSLELVKDGVREVRPIRYLISSNPLGRKRCDVVSEDGALQTEGRC